MNRSTMRLEIEKNAYNGWSCTTYVKHPEFPEVLTHSGHPTLKSALWHQLGHCVNNDYKLLSVKVKGKDMSFEKVWDVVYEALAGGSLAYILPNMKKLLGV